MRLEQNKTNHENNWGGEKEEIANNKINTKFMRFKDPKANGTPSIKRASFLSKPTQKRHKNKTTEDVTRWIHHARITLWDYYK